jgi:hypothetical protein
MICFLSFAFWFEAVWYSFQFYFSASWLAGMQDLLDQRIGRGEGEWLRETGYWSGLTEFCVVCYHQGVLLFSRSPRMRNYFYAEFFMLPAVHRRIFKTICTTTIIKWP